MSKRPLIFQLKGNSLDDGPGIRTVVFFKGCPLSCLWCHNPEGLDPSPGLALESGKCLEGCVRCVEACPHGALQRSGGNTEVVGPVALDRLKCASCLPQFLGMSNATGEERQLSSKGRPELPPCVDACPSGALEVVGRAMSPSEIVDAVRKDIPFFEASGGGVTLSGGEPTLFMDFAGELARKFRALGVHVLLETCGAFDWARFETLLYSHLDLIYYDIKAMDSALFKALCGTDNRRILENFERLFRLSFEGGVPVLPRVPLIPGATATDDNLEAIAGFFRKVGVRKLVLLPYNPLWPDKLDKLGRKRAEEARALPERWMTREALTACRKIFEGFELR